MIGLMDCNNFFVSCERLFRPDLEGKPVAVMSGKDGIIVARSNELKAMGVPMGIPLFQAKKLVDMSGVTLFTSNFALYRDISSRVMKTLTDEVGECEVYSVDEAFFQVSTDITETEIHDLRTRIIKKVGIPVSVGVASTKTLAKVGSEVGKKGEGICLLTAEKWQELAKTYPCSEVWNLGHATTSKLRESGVTMSVDFMNLDKAFIKSLFGVGGLRVQDEINGISVHKLGSNSRDMQQSIMSTRSFEKASYNRVEVEGALSGHVTQVAEKMRQKKLLATKVYVLARAGRHSDFAHRNGAIDVVLDEPTNDTQKLIKATIKAFSKIYDQEIPYKKIGVTMSGLIPQAYRQANLFEVSKEEDVSGVDKVRDLINKKFGSGSIQSAIVLDTRAKKIANLQSAQYTTRWEDIPSVQAK